MRKCKSCKNFKAVYEADLNIIPAGLIGWCARTDQPLYRYQIDENKKCTYYQKKNPKIIEYLRKKMIARLNKKIEDDVAQMKEALKNADKVIAKLNAKKI